MSGTAESGVRFREYYGDNLSSYIVAGSGECEIALSKWSGGFRPVILFLRASSAICINIGCAPQGNVAGQVVGYGMPGDDNLMGTLKLAGTAAAIGPPGRFGLPLAGTPFPNKVLSYTVPPGMPGWADIKLSTSDGTSRLPNAFLYAKSVTDYASADTFAAILYDSGRQRLYLSAGIMSTFFRWHRTSS